MKRSEGHYNKSERTGSGDYAKDESNGLLDWLGSLFSSMDSSASSPQTQEESVPSSRTQDSTAPNPPIQEEPIPSPQTVDTPAPNPPIQEEPIPSPQAVDTPAPNPPTQENSTHDSQTWDSIDEEALTQEASTLPPLTWDPFDYDSQTEEDPVRYPQSPELHEYRPQTWEDVDPTSPIQDGINIPELKTEAEKTLSGMLIGMLMLIVSPYVIIVFLFLVSERCSEQEEQERQKQQQELYQEMQRREEEQRRQNELYRQRLQARQEKERERQERNRQITEKNNLRPKPKTSSNTISYLCTNSNISASEYAYCRNLRDVELESRHIGSKAFLSCSALEEVIVTRNLTQVDSRAFADCRKLSTVIFPKTLRKIGSNIFEDCLDIREISVPYRVREQLCEQIGKRGGIHTLYILTDQFYKMPKGLKEGNIHRPSARLYVPDALLADFCKDPDWILFNEILPLSQSTWYDAKGRYKK